jgi:diadenosine tetraphosphate (Ap4A) HIT family hydrolase
LGKERVPGGPIYEDDLLCASHTSIPPQKRAVYLGWCFVEPRRHVPGLGDQSDAEAQALGRLTARLRAERVYAFVLGDRMPHLHVHLILRHPGTQREYWGTRADEWPGAPRGDERQVAKMVARLRWRLADTLPAKKIE